MSITKLRESKFNKQHGLQIFCIITRTQKFQQENKNSNMTLIKLTPLSPPPAESHTAMPRIPED